jgi:hypothetical protein
MSIVIIFEFCAAFVAGEGCPVTLFAVGDFVTFCVFDVGKFDDFAVGRFGHFVCHFEE